MGCVAGGATDAGGGPGGLATRQLAGEQQERPHGDPVGPSGEDQRHAAIKARQCLARALRLARGLPSVEAASGLLARIALRGVSLEGDSSRHMADPVGAAPALAHAVAP